MKIAVLPGDGIGPEVTAQAVKVLEVLRREGMALDMEHALIGGAAYDDGGHPLPEATLALARDADAILFGAEGGFHYEALPRGLRPGDALLTMRRELDLFANFRPVVAYPELLGASPLKPSQIDGLDLLILRELTGDLYFGEPRGVIEEQGLRVGINTMRYDENEIRRIAIVAFETARTRRRRVCSVDKANVLEAMELWRDARVHQRARLLHCAGAARRGRRPDAQLLRRLLHQRDRELGICRRACDAAACGDRRAVRGLSAGGGQTAADGGLLTCA